MISTSMAKDFISGNLKTIRLNSKEQFVRIKVVNKISKLNSELIKVLVMFWTFKNDNPLDFIKMKKSIL